MVVAQLVELSRSTPEVHDSYPVIGKIYIEQLLLSTLLKNRNIKLMLRLNLKNKNFSTDTMTSAIETNIAMKNYVLTIILTRRCTDKSQWKG